MARHPGQAAQVERVRRFTRFFTREFNVLNERLLDGPFSLIEARVVYEIANHERPTATAIARDLNLDASYLSRTLARLERAGFIARRTSETDARESVIRLTKKGRDGFAAIDRSSHKQVAAMLEALLPVQQARLVGAMADIERLLGGQAAGVEPYLLRTHQPGDIGWVIQTHARLYAQEYGWDESFEALVAEIAAKFIRNFNAKFERCWIAEKDGENVGSVFVVRETDQIAKLRLLIVDPRARGLGIGNRLVDECIRFARHKRYTTLTLWTNDILDSARRIYQRAGFELVEENRHHSFGHDLVGQNWNLKL